MDNLIELFCSVDDFCQSFTQAWYKQLIQAGEKRRHRATQLTLAEMMSLIIYFHQSHYRDFKNYYTVYVINHLRAKFPHLISYARFVALMPSILVPLTAYLNSRKDKVTGISFIDSAKLSVCHNLRINRHKVFAGHAARGKTSTGWFYGFKLHLDINEQGGYLGCCITPGNVDDRATVPRLTQSLWGKLFGDKGYLSKKLFEELMTQGVQLITSIKQNMKNRFLPLFDKLILRKRFIIETELDQLKNISQIEHTRHRSLSNCMVNIIAGLVAYTHQPKKPSLKLSSIETKLLPQLF